MNRESLGLTILRYILTIGLFVFMAMLYWSSSLVEDNVKELRSDMAQIRSDLQGLQQTTQVLGDEMLQAFQERPSHPTSSTSERGTATQAKPKENSTSARSEATRSESTRSQIDPALPNLLKEDKFYAETLPKMLGANFKAKGVRQTATIGKPDDLHPFNNWGFVSGWIDQCNVSLAGLEFGKYETFAPDMAIKIEERKQEGSPISEYWVHLRDNVFWQPLQPLHFPKDFVLASEFLKRHQVTSHDFKFYFDALMNPFVQQPGAAALRNYLGDIAELKIIDDLTFVVRWKTQNVRLPDGTEAPRVKYIARQLTGALKPLARFVYQYFPDGKKILEDDADPETYRKNSVWAQNFSSHWARNIIVSCGPWLFDGMSDRGINFRRNPHHYDPYAVLVEKMETNFRDSPDSVWEDFKAGKTDFYDLRPNQLIEFDDLLKSDDYKKQEAGGLGIHRLDYIAPTYSYIGWNQATPFFKSKKVRQAMTMAIDRKRIIQQHLNNMAIETTGTFFYNSPSYDKKIPAWPFDPRASKRLLEEEGWYDSDGDGIVDKEVDGKRIPFSFRLTYYVKNPTAKTNAEYIATTLKEIGVDCRLNGVDIADLSATFDDKNFDALYLAWQLGSPPEEPKQLWHSSGAKEKGSSNAVGFSSAEADAIIEQLQYEYDSAARIKLYHRFHAILHDEQPYTFLYTAKSVLVYRDYMQNVFIPAERQDLVPGANVGSPDDRVFWLKPRPSLTQ